MELTFVELTLQRLISLDLSLLELDIALVGRVMLALLYGRKVLIHVQLELS